jgi:hypothetical protein
VPAPNLCARILSAKEAAVIATMTGNVRRGQRHASTQSNSGNRM